MFSSSAVLPSGRPDDVEQRSASRESEQTKTTPDEFRLNPWSLGEDLYREYISYQKQYYDWVSQVPNILVMFVHVATHDNYQQSGTDSKANYLFTTGWILAAVAVGIFIVYSAAQIMLARGWYQGDDERDARKLRVLRYIVNDMLWGRIEDATVISGIISNTMLLLGRVFVGQCSQNVSIWDAQACNPFQDAHGIPTDQVLIVYGYCIVCQLLFRGITITALIVNWVIAVGAVMFALIYVGGGIQLYVALYSVLFITMSFEFERRMRVSFLQARLIREAEERRVTLLTEFNKKEQDLWLEKMMKETELKLLSLTTEHEKKLAEAEKFQLRSLMGNVAHDLKTPLHTIEGDLEVLREDFRKALEDPNAKQTLKGAFAKLCDNLETSCRFMTMAINRSQDYMKASSNIALIPANGTLNLSETIRIAASFVQRVQTSRTIVVHPIPLSISPYIISDAHWLTENIMCLVSNAAKYSDKGATVDVRVRLENGVASGNGPMLHFSVEDTGIGISEEARRNLFQPFKQAQRMAGGTGLGLFSLSKRIEALGGTCGVGPREDGKQGSVFWFNIPYRPDTSTFADPAQTPNTTLPSRVSGATTPIGETDQLTTPMLVVDDTPSILKVTERLLQRNGHYVETAENGYQALELLRKDIEDGVKRFDLVLTDLQMPVMDGFEFVRRLRLLEEKTGTPNRQLVIGMSANSDAQSRQEALDAGMDHFVSKPFKYAELRVLLG